MDDEKKYSFLLKYGWFILAVIIAIAFLSGYFFKAGFYKESEDNLVVEVVIDKDLTCNNTIFLFPNNETIKGQDYLLPIDGPSDRWEKADSIEIKNGEEYYYWLKSDDYFVDPTPFTAKCFMNSTNKTFVYVEAYKRSENAELKIIDEYDYSQDKIFFRKKEPERYEAVNLIKYYDDESNISSFMPFGGELIVEYPRRIWNVICAGSNNFYIDKWDFPDTYSMHDINNTEDTFELTLNKLEPPEFIQDEFYCVFEFANPDVVNLIDNKKVYFTLIPRDFYLNKDNELELRTDKSRDEVYEWVTDIQLRKEAIVSIEN